MEPLVKQVSCLTWPLCQKQTYDNVINHTSLNQVRGLIGPKYSQTDVDQQSGIHCN